MTDRLQQAISKARQERQARIGGKSAEAPVPGTRSARPKQDAWQSLPPLVLSRKTIVRNRLTAYTSGETAIPFDMLRTKILHQAKRNDWRRIAIVSPRSECGKSTITANLGFSFSRMKDLKAMVLDFDMRRIGLGRVLGQNITHGMPEVLRRQITFSELALCMDGNVAFGLNGQPTKNPSEILQSKQTADVLDEIEGTYQPDVMLFDMPPLMANDDSHGFLKSVDCALLVVVAEKTPMDQIDVAEKQLSELTNVMGIVLNRCRYTTGAHGYENEYY
jgi:protein-tyrosine kinase